MINAQTFIEKFTKLITDALNDAGYDNFLAGSRRFGYYDGRSDIDIMLFAHPGDRLISLTHFLSTLGLKPINQKRHYSNSNSVWGLGELIHINVFLDKEQYEALEEEHEEVEKFLNENPKVLDFIRLLKPFTNMKGAELYRSIIHQINYCKNVDSDMTPTPTNLKKKTISIEEFTNEKS